MKRSLIPNVALVVLAGCFLAVPFAAGPYVVSLATQALIWVLLAASWDFLSGYTGQVSFGHGGFFAIGAFAAGILAKSTGLPVWVTLPLAFAVAGLFGAAVGIPALRVRGHYLALVTLGFAEVTRLVATNWTGLTGGVFGLSGFGQFGAPDSPPVVAFAIVFAVVAASIAVLQFVVTRTPAGEIFRAIREDPVLAEAQGIDTTFYKVLAFTVSAAFSGLAGALYAYDIQLVGPDLSAPTTSAMIIGMAVLGGLGTLWGPVMGACLLFAANEALRFVGVITNVMLFGVVMMVFVIFLPNGLAGLVERPPRRRVRADTGATRLAPSTPSPTSE